MTSAPSAKAMNGSVSSNYSGKMVDGQAKEFFWGCQLTKENNSATWSYDEEEDDDADFLQHTLFLRHAVLGTGAAKEERNIVQVETNTYQGSEAKHPVVSLTLGKTEMCQLDLNFSQEIPVTFKLVEGTGPVHLTAQHMVEFPPENPGYDEEGDGDYTATEDEALTGDETDPEEGQRKKRKAVPLVTNKKKRGKMDSEVEEEEDEEDEDEDESMEEDEDEDAEDESSEESESEEEKVKKGKKKAKASAVKPNKKGKAATNGKAKKSPNKATKKGKKAKAK